MSTGYGWEGLRQVCGKLLGASHVPERLFGDSVYTWGAVTFSFKALPLLFIYTGVQFH